MQISKNFELKEFTYSSELGITIVPTKIQIQLVKQLVYNVLAPLREEFSCPIYINSGIRNKAINKGLRNIGYKTSYRTDHSYGDAELNPYGTGAADITIDKKELLFDVYKWLREHKAPFINQVIIYFSPDTINNSFIHVSNAQEIFFKILHEYHPSLDKLKFLQCEFGRKGYSAPDYKFLKNKFKGG
jgi:hypothetical protein